MIGEYKNEFRIPDLSNLIQPPPILPNITDYKTQRVVSAIDNIQNINRLRDMDNLCYQIKLKKQQKQIQIGIVIMEI